MPNQTPDISIVVPCYNEEASLPLFLNELAQVVRSMRAAKPLEFEVVLVDDGSSDSTLAIMKEQTNVCCNDYCIKWVSFSRNFGKEAALYAGLEHATGNLVATMDADMQDPHRCYRKCIESCRMRIATTSPRAAQRARANRRFAPGSRVCSTASSTRSPKPTSWTEPVIFAS